MFEIPVPKYMALTGGGAGADDAIAPMTGTVTQVLATAGQTVAAGKNICFFFAKSILNF